MSNYLTEASCQEYTEIAKQNAQVIIEKLNDVAGLYFCGILGQLEQSELTSAGADLMSAIAKLELLKQSL